MAADGVAPDDLLLRGGARFPVTAAENSGAPRTPALLTPAPRTVT